MSINQNNQKRITLHHATENDEINIFHHVTGNVENNIIADAMSGSKCENHAVSSEMGE